MRAAGTPRRFIAFGAAALGFAAGWLVRGQDPPAPAPPIVEAAAPAPPAQLPSPDPLALVPDRVAAVAWWATAPDAPVRTQVERALALPAGVGFFDYLAPVYERAAFDEPDAGEPAALGFFVDLADDGRRCRYLASRVPLAQGGLRVGRACDELTTTPPRWLVVQLEGAPPLLFETATRHLLTSDDPAPSALPTLVFGTDADGRYTQRTATARGLVPSSAAAREPCARALVLAADLGPFATSEVRPLTTLHAPPTETQRAQADAALRAGLEGSAAVAHDVVSSAWLDFAVDVVALEPSGEAVVPLSPAGAGDAAAVGATEGENGSFSRPLALPGHGGAYVMFGTVAAGGARARSVRAVVCVAGGCRTQVVALPAE